MKKKTFDVLALLSFAFHLGLYFYIAGHDTLGQIISWDSPPLLIHILILISLRIMFYRNG